MSKRLVVDASVARASGGEAAEYPLSKNCRDVLKAIQRICHKVVMNSKLLQEWETHESGFAFKFRIWMERKGKVIPSEVESGKLQSRIESYCTDAGDRDAIAKDMHLVEAAISTDNIVISLDDRVMRLIGRAAAEGVPALKNLHWCNPGSDSEDLLAWLEKGAKYQPDKILHKSTRK